MHRYIGARSPSFSGFTSDVGRVEFLTTARILSLAGQLVFGISRERIDFSFLRPSRPRWISIHNLSSSSLRRLIFSSSSSIILFLLFHGFVRPLCSLMFGSKEDLFLRSRNPSFSFTLAQNLTDLPFFISSSENRGAIRAALLSWILEKSADRHASRINGKREIRENRNRAQDAGSSFIYISWAILKTRISHRIHNNHGQVICGLVRSDKSVSPA